jgi:hypothetical protein
LNADVTVYDAVKAAFQEFLVPELLAIRASLQDIRAEVSCLRAELRPWQREVLAEVQRLERRLTLLHEDLRRPISCGRAQRRRRAE